MRPIDGCCSDHEAAAKALERLVTVDEETIRDDAQGLCDFCGEGWEQVPGPRGGKGKHVNTHRHAADCPVVEGREALHLLRGVEALALAEPTEADPASSRATHGSRNPQFSAAWSLLEAEHRFLYEHAPLDEFSCRLCQAMALLGAA